MGTLHEVARDLRAPLDEAQAEALAHWSVDSARRLQDALRTGVAPDGTRLEANTEYTAGLKGENHPGVKSGALMASLGRTIQVLTPELAEVYGSDGQGKNDMKATLLIHGQKRVKGGQTYQQPPRDFVGHDEAVVEKAADRATDLAWEALGFGGPT